jgi:hypothetical protein
MTLRSFAAKLEYIPLSLLWSAHKKKRTRCSSGKEIVLIIRVLVTW